MRELLFETLHGSRLYGFAHEDSDYDYYRVVTSESGDRYTSKRRYSHQKISESGDVVTKDLSTWLHECEKGTPQALEAMFSTLASTDRIEALRAAFRVSTPVLDTYYRTAKNFALSGDFKRRRHSLRLALNARDLLVHGRFNPTLSPGDVAWATLWAKSLSDEDLWKTVKFTMETVRSS